MKIIHTADLHLGQVIYSEDYGRADEHLYFFEQLKRWCRAEHPDALVVSGDVFDVQQPSAGVWKLFTDCFVGLRLAVPSMKIVVIAGNHDSPSRIDSNHSVWSLADTRMVGVQPPLTAGTNPHKEDGEDGEDKEDGEDEEDGGAGDWRERYIVRLPGAGYIVALPFSPGERRAATQALLDRVAEENSRGLPVVLMGHLAVTGSDCEGHSQEIGRVRTLGLDSLGTGWDYLALGHLHKPQTLGHPDDSMKSIVRYPAPVARYSGSVLHVSCDEAYPHTVSLVEIDRHGGEVTVSQLRIDELRHFHTLPPTDLPPFASAGEALDGLKEFADAGAEGYVRLRMAVGQRQLPGDFKQNVHKIIESTNGRLRFNPRLYGPEQADADDPCAAPRFEVAELQQMDTPLDFIVKTIDRYPELDLEDVRRAFVEIEAELRK